VVEQSKATCSGEQGMNHDEETTYRERDNARKSLGDGPIQPDLIEVMNALARGLDKALNGDAKGNDRQNGFVLLVFPFEGRDGRCNYISNGARHDIVTLMREQIARFEGQPEVKGTA